MPRQRNGALLSTHLKTNDEHMKRMIYAAGTTLAALLFCMPLGAQNETAEKEFSTFTSLEVGGYFQLNLVISDEYKAEWTTDKKIIDYVDIYCRNKVLHIGMSDEGLSYIKRNYKSGSAPALTATVYVPTLNSISLSDNAILDFTGATLEVDGLSVRADGRSAIHDFTVISDAGTVSLSVAKYGEINASVVSDVTEVVSEQSGVINLTQDSRALTCTSSGSSTISVSGDAERVVCNTKGTSTVTLGGAAISLEGIINGGSTLDASGCELDKAMVTMNGGVAAVNPAMELIIDIKAGAELTYGKDPVVDIVGVNKSTIKRYENPTAE